VNEKATDLKKAGCLARENPSFGLGKTLRSTDHHVSYAMSRKLVRGRLWKRNLRPE